MREVEVLYDHLLAMFQQDPALAPRDIGVMIPDIEAYAPFIQAVFAAQPEDAPKNTLRGLRSQCSQGKPGRRSLFVSFGIQGEPFRAPARS